MRALLVAAGLGTRLRPLTDTIPKCLAPVGGRPLLHYWLEGLFASGVERLLVNLHYLPDVVRRFVAESAFRDRIDLVHEPVLLGTAGTIRANRAWFGDQPFFYAHADNFCVCDLRAFMAAHRSRPKAAAMTMMTFDAPDPTQCGIVKLGDTGLVTEFHEKVPHPPGRLANAAVFILEPEVADFCAKLTGDAPEFSRAVVPEFLGRIYAWHNTTYHLDIGTPQALAQADADTVRLRSKMAAWGWLNSND